MIALVTTYFLVFYILVPGVLFRFLTSWFVTSGPSRSSSSNAPAPRKPPSP